MWMIIRIAKCTFHSGRLELPQAKRVTTHEITDAHLVVYHAEVRQEAKQHLSCFDDKQVHPSDQQATKQLTLDHC